MIDPAPSLALPLNGLVKRRELPCGKAGLNLLTGLGVLNREGKLSPMNPSRFADHPDEGWARVSYALALLVELFRVAPTLAGDQCLLVVQQRPVLDELIKIQRSSHGRAS